MSWLTLLSTIGATGRDFSVTTILSIRVWIKVLNGRMITFLGEKKEPQREKKWTQFLVACLRIWKWRSQESSHSTLSKFLKSKIHSMCSLRSLGEKFWVARKKNYLMLLKIYLRTYIITIVETAQS